jgi:hypothetical protein
VCFLLKNIPVNIFLSLKQQVIIKIMESCGHNGIPDKLVPLEMVLGSEVQGLVRLVLLVSLVELVDLNRTN